MPAPDHTQILLVVSREERNRYMGLHRDYIPLLFPTVSGKNGFIQALKLYASTQSEVQGSRT